MSGESDRPDYEELTRSMRAYYDGSVSYAEGQKRRNLDRLRDYVELVRRYAPGSRVLDLGCGHGQTTAMLRETGFQVTGIDASRLFLREARHEQAGTDFAVASVEQLPIRSGTVDAVASIAVIEHIPDAEQALREMARIVALGGVVIVHAPNLLSPLRPLFYLARILLGKPGKAVWGETAADCVRNFFGNVAATICKRTAKGLRFDYRTPVLVEEFGLDDGDADACFVANPIDISRFLRAQGLEIVDYRRPLPGEHWLLRSLRRVAPDFVSPTIVVARRPHPESASGASGA